MKYLISIILLVSTVGSVSAQSLACTGGRALYARDYANLFSEYPGTAATVEACSAACEQSDPDNRMTCFVGGCGLACLIIGMGNCIDYYSAKLDIDGRRDGIEAICEAEEDNQETEEDLSAWARAENSNSISAYEVYINNCNSVCAFRTEAYDRLAPLYVTRDENAWDTAQRARTERAAQQYLDNCSPTCVYATEAQTTVDTFRDLSSWGEAEVRSTVAGFEHYLIYCNSICAFKVEAENRLAPLYVARDEAAWATAERIGSADAAQRYLESCNPRCAYESDAQPIIEQAAARRARMSEWLDKQFFAIGVVANGPILFLPFILE